MDLESTIVAISSPRGNSMRALLRISGSSAICGSECLGLSPTFGETLAQQLQVGENKLPVLVSAFKKNASYTGDDLVEIQFAGNPVLATRLIRLFVDATDGREATAGEFTARAFFSGRITLAQAEGVSATISASNNAELAGAALLREGVLSKLTDPMTIRLTRTLALIEAGIDFTDEEDVEAISKEKLLAELRETKDGIQSLIDHSIPMSALRNLPRVVLAGKPNAGKSTLFNALVGKQRVVVDAESGTTRDAIEEEVTFGSTKTVLVDVAGIEVCDDEISSSAQIAAQHALDTADLILWCVAPDNEIPAESERTIVVETKADQIRDHTDAVSALSGSGIKKLQSRIFTYLQVVSQRNKDAVALLPRHEEHLQSALVSIQEAEVNCHTPELCASCLRDSLRALGEITGKISPDDVLEHVFSSFCVGK